MRPVETGNPRVEYITCKELIDFLDDYVDDAQPPAVRHEFERHLAVCPPCVAYLNTYRETIRLGRSLCAEHADAIPVPEDVPEDLIRAILAARAKRPD